MMNENPMSVTLPLCSEPPFTFFLHHALPLSMILANSRNINFVYSNYIQLYKPTNKNYLLDIYPRIGAAEIYGKFPLDNIIDNTILTGDIFEIDCEQLIYNMINWIDNGYYISITSDERKLKGTAQYNNDCFKVHPAFYFGYDRDSRKMKMLAFDNEYKFTVLDIDYSDIKTSFCSKELKDYLRSIGVRKYLIELKKVRQDVIDYNYTDEKSVYAIKNGLREYLYGVNSSMRCDLKQSIYDKSIWGVNIYDNIINCFNGTYNSSFLFQCMCGFYEHKLVMIDRLKFLASLGYYIPDEYMEKYYNVVSIASNVKLMSYKYKMTKSHSLSEKIIEKVNDINRLEHDVLFFVYNLL